MIQVLLLAIELPGIHESASGQKSVTSRKSADVSVAFLKYGRYTRSWNLLCKQCSFS